MRRGIGRLRAGGSGNPAFVSIANLFLTKTGAWYEPSDLTTMFQDTGGVTPAVVDSPVARINDKSGYGFHLTQSTGSACPVLRNAGAIYWLEFDGLDDVLTGATGVYTGVGPTHYMAMGLSRSVENASAVFAATNSGSSHVRIDNVSSSGRLTGRYRNVSGNFSIPCANNGVPLSTVVVADSQASPSYLDIGIKAVLTTTVTTTTSGDSIGNATISLGNPTVSLNCYGGLTLIGAPSAAQRTGIQQYLAGKSGISF